MDLKDLPNTDNRYVFRLKINSEEDLLEMDEATGEKKYTPITKEDVAQFKREAEHLCKEIQYAIEDIQWNPGKHKGLTHYYHIYQDLAEQLTDFLKYIHQLHKKVYITIYKSYDNELMAIYTEILEKVLKDILDTARKHADYLLDVEFGQMPSGKDLFKMCKKQEAPAGADFSSYESCYKNFISCGLKLALEQTVTTVTSIYNDFNDLYRTLVFRTDEEAVVIYHYIKRNYDEHTLPGHLENEASVMKNRMETRRIPITTANLQKVMAEVDGKYKNYTLCFYWFEHVKGEEEDDEEEKSLVHEFVRKEASPEEYETLFKFQGELKMWAAEIARTDEYERHGDPFFENWVDSFKLEEMLQFWIKGNITSQKNWYIVWCLMNYTFHMVREGKDKNDFAARMNLMFPNAEKKCVVESFRKLETQKNHNRHFSEWLEGSDPDYQIAHSLYEKLKKTEEYKRSI